MEIDSAIEAFVRGFSFTRSFTHPYVAERIGKTWVMRDAERKHGVYRNEEYVAHGVAPEELDAAAKQHTRGRYVINAIRSLTEPDSPVRASFRSLGYRLTTTEALMFHFLSGIEPNESAFPIVRVATHEDAMLLHAVTRKRQILPAHLIDPEQPIRQYMALDGKVPVGWAASIAAGPCRWCSNVFVKESHRRRGIARAMLTRLLQDDRDAGSLASVLLASHAGAKLYPTVGYEQLGELLMFMPPRDKTRTEAAG